LQNLKILSLKLFYWLSENDKKIGLNLKTERDFSLRLDAGLVNEKVGFYPGFGEFKTAGKQVSKVQRFWGSKVR